MAGRIRLLSRNTIRQRQQLRLMKGLALLTFVGVVFSYLYIFVNDIQSVRAARANALKQEGRLIIDGYHGRLKIKLNTTFSAFDAAVPICIKVQNDQLKNIRYGGKVISKEANDICLAASDGGSIIKYSIERYNPQKGEITFWMYPNAGPNAGHQEISKPIYLYYGNELEAKSAKTIPTPSYYKAIWNFNGTFDAHGLEYVFGEFKGVKDEEGLFGLAKSFLSIERSAAVFDAGKNMEFDGSFSLSVWIKPQTVTAEQTLYTNEALNGGCRLYLNKSGRICFKIIDSEGRVSSIDNEWGGSILPLNEWVHVAAVYNEDKKHMYICINGEVDREKSVSTKYAAGKLIILGAHADLKHGFYNGLMDEFRIADKALSPKQIEIIYNNDTLESHVAQITNEELRPNDAPLYLEHFTCRPEGNTIQVDWTTKNEKQLDYFIVERSNDTFKCSEVTKLLSKGGKVRYNRYSANDTAPKSGKSFYRLRFFKQNGRSDSSAWQAVYYNPEAQSFID
jgi:hypothetical protein